MFLTLPRVKAVRILEEKRGDDKKTKYLVEFAGESEPQWADKVSAHLLERWRIQQQCGQEMSLVDYLGLSPGNLKDAVPDADREELLKTAALQIQKVLHRTMRYHKRNELSCQSRYDLTLICAPKVGLMD